MSVRVTANADSKEAQRQWPAIFRFKPQGSTPPFPPVDWEALKKAYSDGLKGIYTTYDGTPGITGDISEAETLELTLPSCTANPNCGEDDVICPQCKAGNCPGVKCWRGCE